MFLLSQRIVESKCSSIGCISIHATHVVNISIEMPVARESPSQTCLEYGTLPVASCVVVVSCVAIAHRSKQARVIAQYQVGIKTSLKREQTFGLAVGILLKRLDMIISEVATERKTRSDVEVLAYTIEQSTREMLVESEVMGAYTYYIIGASVAETYSQVGLCSRSAVSHDVDTGIRIDIDESNLMSKRVATVVDICTPRGCATHTLSSPICEPLSVSA